MRKLKCISPNDCEKLGLLPSSTPELYWITCLTSRRDGLLFRQLFLLLLSDNYNMHQSFVNSKFCL